MPGHRTPKRSILHVDMDAFFAAIEQRDRPELAGKPVLVGSDQRRGVVTTASYEARPFGCHSAQPMAVAKRLCPHAIVVPVRGHVYGQVSQQLLTILHDYTPQVEPISIDEAFLDVTGTQRLFGRPEQLAAAIKKRIHAETGLTASVGVAPNKFLAKLASDLEKPDGLTVICHEDIDRVLDPLPVSKIWGIGPATAARFQAMGVRTVHDLRKLTSETLDDRFGDYGRRFYRLCRGLDRRTVTADGRAKSIGQECTFEYDVEDRAHLRFVLLGHVEHVGYRLRKAGLRARTMTVKIRFGQFQTITRGATFATSTHATDDLWRVARRLFESWAEKSFAPVRLVGASAGQLTTGGEQMELFATEGQRQQRLDQVKDQIKDRFGKKAIARGASGSG